MCIVIVCFPSCGVINFEINLIFGIKPFFYMAKKSRQKIKYLENKNRITYIFSISLKLWACYITGQWGEFIVENATLYLHILSWHTEKFIFFWWNIKFPKQNVDESDTGIDTMEHTHTHTHTHTQIYIYTYIYTYMCNIICIIYIYI